MVTVKAISKLVVISQLICLLGNSATPTKVVRIPSSDEEVIRDLDLLEHMDEVDSMDEVSNDKAFEEVMPPVKNDDKVKGMEDQGAPPKRRKGRGRLPYGDFPGT